MPLPLFCTIPFDFPSERWNAGQQRNDPIVGSRRRCVRQAVPGSDVEPPKFVLGGECEVGLSRGRERVRGATVGGKVCAPNSEESPKIELGDPAHCSTERNRRNSAKASELAASLVPLPSQKPA